MTEDERLEAINQLANGYGMSLLDMVGGDWRLALSVTVALLGSTLAQASIELKEEISPLLDDSLSAARITALAFHDKLTETVKPALTEASSPSTSDEGSEES